MNDRFSQDAADTLAGLEAIAAAKQQRDAEFREVTLQRWEKSQPKPIVSTWAPTITEQERQEREALIQAGILPF